MTLDAWLPVDFMLPDGQRTRRALIEGDQWQIFEMRDAFALVVDTPLVEQWVEWNLLQQDAFQVVHVAGRVLQVLVTPENMVLLPLAQCLAPSSGKEVRRFAEAFAKAREAIGVGNPLISLSDSIYCETLGVLLPTLTTAPAVPDDIVFGRWITGGVTVSVRSWARLRKLTSWLPEHFLVEILQTAGLPIDPDRDNDIGGGADTLTDLDGEPAARVPAPRTKRAANAPTAGAAAGKPFSLAGRPKLTRFLQEHVIDIIENPARYEALKIGFPSAIILHGQPGCGKTYAIDRLIDYLGWPSFQIDAASVASPYIHATSKKISEVFQQAFDAAPAVVVMDEMESFVADRSMGSGSSTHRIEEVAEFLRRIPEAMAHRVLVIGMTNKIEMIDPAILRRGRFDHVIKVDMASAEEVEALLTHLLDELPCEADIDATALAAELQGRPLSDVTYVVREAARLAASRARGAIDAGLLAEAIASTPSRTADGEQPSRKIGFT